MFLYHGDKILPFTCVTVCFPDQSIHSRLAALFFILVQDLVCPCRKPPVCGEKYLLVTSKNMQTSQWNTSYILRNKVTCHSSCLIYNY